MSKRNGKLAKLFVLLTILVAVVLFGLQSDLTRYLEPSMARMFVDEAGIFGPIVFIVIYAITVPLALPSSPMTILSGTLFGPWFGTLYTVIGATTGSIFAFLIAKHFGRDYVRKMVSEKLPQLSDFEEQIEENGFFTTLFLRFIPLFPFAALSYALGLSPVRLRSYIAATIIGTIPGSFAFVYFGDSLASFSVWSILFAFGILVFFMVLVTTLKRLKKLRKNEYDMIVIGAGSGGLNMAMFMHKIGAKVLLLDKSAESIGGDCLNHGCVPSKALIHAARKVQEARNASAFGVKLTGEVNMQEVHDYIKGKQNVIRDHENLEYFNNIGLKTIVGETVFSGSDSVTVEGKKYRAKTIILATGSRPRMAQIPGIEKVNVLTNESIFDLTKLPGRLLVVGGGPIGMEMAQAFNMLGSHVTVVNRDDRVLVREDKDMARLVQEKMEKNGVEFHLSCEVKEFTSKDSVTLVNKEGKESSVTFDAALLAIGRTLNTEGLNLKKARIKTDERGRLILNKRLRTTNKRVYACGDVAGAHQFTHTAEVHAGMLIRNFLSPKKSNLNTDHMAWVTYLDPELATFGLSEHELKERGVRYEVIENDFKEDDRAIVDDYGPSLVKLFVRRGRLLGGTMLAPRAGELVQELLLLNAKGMKLTDLMTKVYPYPTATRINKRLAGQHLSKKLTKRNKGLLRVLYRLFS